MFYTSNPLTSSIQGYSVNTGIATTAAYQQLVCNQQATLAQINTAQVTACITPVTGTWVSYANPLLLLLCP